MKARSVYTFCLWLTNADVMRKRGIVPTPWHVFLAAYQEEYGEQNEGIVAHAYSEFRSHGFVPAWVRIYIIESTEVT